MDHTLEAADPVGTISSRVKELRTRKGWTGADLGNRLVTHGVRWDRSIIANLENGRRATVSVTELLALARALDVSPLHLLVPVNDGPYSVTPKEVQPAERVRAWVRGESALPGTDERIFRTEVPLGEWDERMQAARSLTERLREAGAEVRELPERRKRQMREALPEHLRGEGEGEGGSTDGER